MAKKATYQEALANYQDKVPKLAAALRKAFPNLTNVDIAAICGNAGAESYGMTAQQEWNPTVAGSAGGLGWFQWTGMNAAKGGRRALFTNWCKQQGLTPTSDEANIGYLIHELKNTFERKALSALAAADNLKDKTIAFEASYERAGVKHYDSRVRWAERALAILEGMDPGTVTEPGTVKKAPAQKRQWAEETLAVWEVEAIQKRLRELGYFQVGKVDGIWGPNTTGAIAALQAHEGITVDGHYGPQTKEALAKAAPREVSEERAQTTKDDLRQQGSSIIKEADAVKWMSWILGLGSALIPMLQYILANYATASDSLGPLKLFMGDIPGWAWPIIGVVVAAYQYYKANKIQLERVWAERTGLHNGEPDPSGKPVVYTGQLDGVPSNVQRPLMSGLMGVFHRR